MEYSKNCGHWRTRLCMPIEYDDEIPTGPQDFSAVLGLDSLLIARHILLKSGWSIVPQVKGAFSPVFVCRFPPFEFSPIYPSDQQTKKHRRSTTAAKVQRPLYHLMRSI